MSLYPVILPLGERGVVQERWIALEDTVVAVNVSTGPGTGGGGTKHTYGLHSPCMGCQVQLTIL